MGSQNNDPSVAGSSIALLQERFRQLERLREKREEREVVKLLSEPKWMMTSTETCHQLPKISFPHKRQCPSSQVPVQNPLHLGLGKHGDFQAMKSRSLHSTETREPDSFETSDVDTSLHL
ncbi:unnamed protein product [Fraxinus pennsylvanica]|uniref:Uncharacterized protein n=1 Tax=Fraxinus pennsylvanica TaxID=56036 RepID=A0AAD1ZR20_9LAMI|nr:unnamed protein product [Fraxinus pennsylvanica]